MRSLNIDFFSSLLKELADDCDEDKVYEFLFVAPPLPVTKACGSPINPQAIK